MDWMLRRYRGVPGGGGAWPAARAVLALVLALAATAPARALDLRDLFGGPRSYDGRVAEAPPVARYVSQDDDSFVLDRSGPETLLRFDGDDEIWALKSSPAARGDVVYRNDLGQLMLRATRLGGVTVFTRSRPSGVAAALEGPAPALEPRQVNSAPALLQLLANASIRAGHAVHHLVSFEAPNATHRSAPLIADAAGLCAKAIERRAHAGHGALVVARTRLVRLIVGDRVEARLQHGMLEITVDPDRGLAGRPSSRRIERLFGK